GERYSVRTTRKENLEASDAFFANLTKEIHKRGMKVIIDGVFNHCGSFHKWMNREGLYKEKDGYPKGAYESKDSPYRKFFRFDDDNNPDSYEAWWGFKTLPKLNYEGSEELCEYICGIGAKWVSEPYNVDGWRLDVAADLGHSEDFNHNFWKKFRKAVKKANPNAVILAEHYGDASAWLKGDEWDTVMNYDAFMEPVTWFLTGMEKHSDEFRSDALNNEEMFINSMKENMARFQGPSLYCAMNELSNHDHSRFLTRTNRKVGRLAELGEGAASEGINKDVFTEAVVMQMTWPGAPTLYYGDEAGLCGFTDPDNRRPYPWGKEDAGILQVHKDLIEIHRAYTVLKNGAFVILHCEHGILSYGRFNSEEQIFVVINNNDFERNVSFSLDKLCIKDNALVSLYISECGFPRPEARILEIMYEKRLSLNLKPHSAYIYKNFPTGTN
nr:alpha-glycosidase [Lachnospiraceae bacterium]